MAHYDLRSHQSTSAEHALEDDVASTFTDAHSDHDEEVDLSASVDNGISSSTLVPPETSVNTASDVNTMPSREFETRDDNVVPPYSTLHSNIPSLDLSKGIPEGMTPEFCLQFMKMQFDALSEQNQCKYRHELKLKELDCGIRQYEADKSSACHSSISIPLACGGQELSRNVSLVEPKQEKRCRLSLHREDQANISM